MRLGKRRIGIATVLTAAFGGLIAITTGALLFLSLNNTLESTRNNLGLKLENLINDAAQQSQAFYQPVEAQANWLAQEIVAGRVDLNDQRSLKILLLGAVSTLPQIDAVTFQYPDGSGFFYDANRNTIENVEWRKAWRVRLTPKAKEGEPLPPSPGRWVLRPSVIDGKPDSTFIIRARSDEGDIGVVGVRLNLSSLSKSLASDATFRDFDLVRFLLLNDRDVIGHPLLQGFDETSRPTIAELNDPYLKQLEKGERFELRIVGDIPGVDTFALQTDHGQRIFAIMDDNSRQAGGNLKIGVHFDPQAGAAELQRLLSVAVIGVSLLLVSILIAFFLGRRAAAPMRQLANAAQLVQGNELEKVEPLPIGSVRELAAAATAFNEMVVGLRERSKIRDLFGKYVPQDVANLLLSDDNTAEPKNAEATVLFLDIVGFSSISEKLKPSQVVAVMNAFFSDVVELIEAENGMVIQFQGDAILAVFNVPLAREDHAAAAIRSSLSIVETIREKKYVGHELDCRIGINTGPLVAGAIGAKDRLSYTIYGDAVNVAARLEQMNKEYGTQVLVSGTTTELVDGYSFKVIGEVPIRGREKPVAVFTFDAVP